MPTRSWGVRSSHCYFTGLELAPQDQRFDGAPCPLNVGWTRRMPPKKLMLAELWRRGIHE